MTTRKTTLSNRAGGFGKLVRFGKLPVDFKLQAFSNVVKPEGGPDWSLMFAMKFLFPK